MVAVRASSLASFTATGTEPTGSAQGDILIAFVTTNGGANGSPTGPAGWTSELDFVTQTSSRITVWSIKRGASAPSYVWTIANTAVGILIWANSGGDTATWIDATPTGSDNASSTAPTSPSITTVTSGALLLVGIFSFPGGAYTVPSGFSQDINDSANDMAGAHKTAGAFGATGTFAWAQPNVVSGTVTIAIRPGPAGASDAVQTSPAPQRKGARAFRATPSGILGMPPPIVPPAPGAEIAFHKTAQMRGPRAFRPTPAAFIPPPAISGIVIAGRFTKLGMRMVAPVATDATEFGPGGSITITNNGPGGSGRVTK